MPTIRGREPVVVCGHQQQRRFLSGEMLLEIAAPLLEKLPVQSLCRLVRLAYPEQQIDFDGFLQQGLRSAFLAIEPGCIDQVDLGENFSLTGDWTVYEFDVLETDVISLGFNYRF